MWSRSPRSLKPGAIPNLLAPKASLEDRWGAALDKKYGVRTSALRIFERIDKDRTGTLSAEEALKSIVALQINADKDEIDKMLREADLKCAPHMRHAARTTGRPLLLGSRMRHVACMFLRRQPSMQPSGVAYMHVFAEAALGCGDIGVAARCGAVPRVFACWVWRIG